MIQVLPGNVYWFQGFIANPLLLAAEENFCALDVATPSAAQAMARFVQHDLQAPLAKLTLIATTHFHWDHIGGMETLRKLTGAKTLLHPETGKFINLKKKIPFPAFKKWLRGIFTVWKTPWLTSITLKDILTAPLAGIPFIKSRLSFTADLWMEAGGCLPGFPAWQVLFTPGHSPDSVCLYHAEQKVLISGDTIVNFRGTGELNPFHVDTRQLCHAFHRLKVLPVNHLYPGHGPPLHHDELWQRIRLFPEALKTS